jgi:hypothetical protein
MKELSATPRWPLYDKRCREWTAAIKQISGEFRRDRSGDFSFQFLICMHGVLGAWMLWATTIGPYSPHESPFDWLLPSQGAVLLGLSFLWARKVFGVRYRFMHGEVCEISSGGRIRWREPLVTLERVTFPWPARYGPQMLTLHWTTHQPTIELFPSIDAAVSDILRKGRTTPAELPERPWRCERCGDENPESFEVCWKCGTAGAGQRQ